jgi:AAA family ATP:ADP antiporter
MGMQLGHERLKLLFLSLLFFLTIGGYTVIRTVKDSLFTNIVGDEYLGWAKMWSIIILIPAILIFSKLVDLMRRYQLLYVYSMFYGLGGLVIAYFIGHPVVGLLNTEPSKYRVFGWLIYFFLEGMNPFLVGLAWSFSNSITNPNEAKINYPLMVAAAKVGGMLTAGASCLFLVRKSGIADQLLFDISNHQILLSVCSMFFLLIPLLIYYFVHKVPGRFMHGYEAAYKFEKQHEKEGRKGVREFFSDMFSGLVLLIRNPYSLGIFGVVFFWEIVNVFLNLERIVVAKKTTSSMSGQTFFMLQQDFWVHMIGIIITLVGTRTFLALLGERRSLLFVPFVVGILLICYFSFQSAAALSFVFILARSINYAFAQPLRESLYIPTTKEIKFKSKTWIEGFGVKVAKGVGGTYITFMNQLAKISEPMVVVCGMGFFSVVIGLWMVTAHLLGRRFEKAVANNEVIGS